MDYSKWNESTLRLSDNFYVISGPDKSRFPFCNAFLLTGSENILIDTGIGGKKLAEIDKTHRIDTIIVSHSHPDHTLNWEVLRDRRLIIPKESPDDIHDLLSQGKRFAGNAANGAYWADYFGRGLGLKPLREPDGRFGDGDVLEIGDFQLEAIHTPGHLRDHYCFFEKKRGVLLTSDIDFTAFGPWYGHPECDIDLFIRSVRKVMAFSARITCSSHKPPIFGDTTKDFNDFLEAFSRHRDIVWTLCRHPQSLESLIEISPFYRNRAADLKIQNIFEKYMIQKNLDILIREKKMFMDNGCYQSVE